MDTYERKQGTFKVLGSERQIIIKMVAINWQEFF